MTVVSYGAGTNSLGLLLAAQERGYRPDAILFADTGAERPETYAHLDVVLTPWLRAAGWPDLTVVRWIPRSGTFVGLADYYRARRELPSVAYGFAGCSDKFKRQPLDRAAKSLLDVREAHGRGERVERWVGYDAGEAHRARALGKAPEPHLWTWRAPLVEWEIDREDCRALIARHGLPQPGKSACFCCPQSRKSDVYDLSRTHPDLFARAVDIERAAAVKRTQEGLQGGIIGLGRYFAWEPLAGQVALFAPPVDETPDDLPCGCVSLRAPSHRRVRAYARRAAALDAHRHLLGVVPDAVLARCAGVHPSTVTKMRARETGCDWRSLRS